MLAIEEVKTEDWFRGCEVWLYRGAWQEFEPHEIHMAVPLSPAELQRKIQAIFRHQSQKDSALFPGADPREFWQRARDRNMVLPFPVSSRNVRAKVLHSTTNTQTPSVTCPVLAVNYFGSSLCSQRACYPSTTCLYGGFESLMSDGANLGFWLQATAKLYDQLGLTEYEAVEAFVRYDPDTASLFFSGKGLDLE